MSTNRLPLLYTFLLFALCSAAGATNLESALAESGWSVSRSSGGDLIIRPLRPRETPAAQPEKDSMESLRHRLEAGGWNVQRDEDGSLIVTRSDGKPAEEPPLPLLNADARARLEKAGWRLEETADGSLLLTPPSGKADEAEQTDPMEDFRRELQAAGWTTQRAEDGSLLLFPSTPGTERDTEEDSSVVMSEELQERLRDAGWTVQQGAGGELLLYPPGKDGPAVPACPGVGTTARVSLPVDSWEEATAIAQSWLETQPLENAAVGRIRKILRVHLVSIVNATRPHRLRHQIAIRNRDGAVIVLD